MIVNSTMGFEFENDQKLFFTGKTVEGILKLTVRSEVDVTKVELHLRAISNVDPQLGLEGRLNLYDNQEKKISVSNHKEVFFECIMDLYKVSPEFTMKEGLHSLPFSMPLPANSPPALEDPLGYIRYTLMAVMEEQSEKCTTTHRISTFISVNKLLDTNHIPKAMLPKVVEAKRNTYCGCIITGPIQATLQVGRRAFVPGENIPINAQILNYSSTPVLYVKIRLVQKVRFLGAKKYYHYVAEAMRGSIMAHHQQMWKNEFLLIPPLPSTTTNNKISITYKVHMRIERTNEKKKVTLKVPIVIGNIPLKELAPSFIEGVSDLAVTFSGPHYPLVSSGPCAIASKLECEFVPSYVTYTASNEEIPVELTEN